MLKYSFVIPTYNNKTMLLNTLEALNYQDGFGKDDYEVIVSDDGSDDNTREYIKGVNKNYSLKYIYIDRDENSCRSKTRNMGYRSAEGEIIIFLDSDIIVRNDYLKEVERSFNIEPNILLFGTRVMLQEKVDINTIKDGSIFNKDYFNMGKEDLFEHRHIVFDVFSYNTSNHPFVWNLLYSCNIAISRKNIELIGGFDVNFKNWGMEDTEFGYRAFINKINLVYNYKLEVLHQYHLSALSTNRDGFRKNAEYFYEKHPEALSFLPYEERIKTLIGDDALEYDEQALEEKHNIVMNMKRIIREGFERRGLILEGKKNIEFKNKDELVKVKNEVLSSLKQGNVMIIIDDYVEDSDLDIWVQLLDNRLFNIEYYANSRKNFFKKN